MPVVSQRQRRFMYAVEEGKVAGVKPSVGRDFVESSHGLRNLPERAHRIRRQVGDRLRSRS